VLVTSVFDAVIMHTTAGNAKKKKKFAYPLSDKVANLCDDPDNFTHYTRV